MLSAHPSVSTIACPTAVKYLLSSARSGQPYLSPPFDGIFTNPFMASLLSHPGAFLCRCSHGSLSLGSCCDHSRHSQLWHLAHVQPKRSGWEASHVFTTHLLFLAWNPSVCSFSFVHWAYDDFFRTYFEMIISWLAYIFVLMLLFALVFPLWYIPLISTFHSKIIKIILPEFLEYFCYLKSQQLLFVIHQELIYIWGMH